LIEVQFVKPITKTTETLTNEVQITEDCYLYIRSEQKALKELSMECKFSEQLEEELKNLSDGLSKKEQLKTLKKSANVWEESKNVIVMQLNFIQLM